MEVLWQANLQVIRRALQDSGSDSAEIRGVACTGHGRVYPLGQGRESGLCGIVNRCTEPGSNTATWAKDGTAAKVFPQTMQTPLACPAGSPVALVPDNQPGFWSGFEVVMFPFKVHPFPP